MAFASGPVGAVVLEEAVVLDTKFDHGAFVVVGRSLVGADDLPPAEAEELLAGLLQEDVAPSPVVQQA